MRAASRVRPAPPPPSRCALLSALCLLAGAARAAAAPQTVPLRGGLMHSSGFFLNATVGGQPFHLQVDTSQGALTLPDARCTTCRVGDRRYDAAKSGAGGAAVACRDARCDRETCSAGGTGECPICASGGRCCVPGPAAAAESVSIFAGDAARGASCAFNLKFSEDMDGNGTMHVDTLQIDGGAKIPGVLFGAMREETRSFEAAYADGTLGLGFQRSARHPSRTPAVMDYFANETGLPNVFTMCVNRYGGTLVLGAADRALTTGPFTYVDALDVEEGDHYVVAVLGHGKVDDILVQLPELATGVWSSATTSIAVGQATFLAILETLMEHYCHVPGLCSVNSWFRPQTCRVIEDEDLKKMPTLTFYLAGNVPIALEPEDYLLAYKVVDGKLFRCVAFIVTDLLAKRGFGILLGAIVMRRHAVAYDGTARRVGVAPADTGRCGPAAGSTAGLTQAALGLAAPRPLEVLTADTPLSAGASTPAEFELAEACRAIDGCYACARNVNCSYGYSDGRCVSTKKAGAHPFPFCTGVTCACIAVGETGWYIGIVLGALLALAAAGCCWCAYTRRHRKQRYQTVVPFESSEREVEVF
jgi:hypothetical protein